MSGDGIDARQYSPEGKPRPIGVGEKFIDNLKEKGLLIGAAEFETAGEPATESTNEIGNPSLFEKVRHQDQAPNGYFIGIGAANVFSMLEAYSEGQEPRAIILFDVDPAVVAEGQRLIQVYKETAPGPPGSLNSWERIFSPHYNASPANAMKKYARLLHQLAVEGNLTIARADFNNPRLTEELANLPDFKKLNKVIYLSNIADHLWRREASQNPLHVPNFDFLNRLAPEGNHKNYYIDTLLASLSYHLRIGTYPPRFQSRDFFIPSALSSFQTELTDQIDGPNENILWEDTRNWPLDQLTQYYNQILQSPVGAERRRYIEDEIRRVRSDTLRKYPEYKEKTKQPPEKYYPGTGKFWLYELPETPEEEEQLLRDLQRPYDYERDFLSFIAHGYWQDATTPDEVNPNQISRKPLPSLNTAEESREYFKYVRIDPREDKRGEIEIRYIRSKITYEDLALAKLYRELKSRVLARRSGAQTQGKNFFELSTEAKPPV